MCGRRSYHTVGEDEEVSTPNHHARGIRLDVGLAAARSRIGTDASYPLIHQLLNTRSV